ncbi:MAG: efflux RND transporter periplasmic adaptor subunit [Agarilytica sp.]
MNISKWNANSKLALGLSFGLVIWMLLGLIPTAEDDEVEPSSVKAFTVQVAKVSAQTYQKPLHVRGRTEANRSVLVAAEIDGLVIKTPAKEGYPVSQGDALCVLESQDRLLRLEQSKAQRNKARIEYEGALSLKDRGYQSKTQIATAKANLALADAEVEASALINEKLVIRAPFNGVVQERMIDAGGFIQRGSPCARLIELSPLIVVGHIPESQVLNFKVGEKATVRFIDGQEQRGVVRYVSQASDGVTRTFKVEVQLPNKGHSLRDGLSAEMTVLAAPVVAHHISPSLLSLSSDGDVVIKVLEGGNTAVQKPVSIVGDDAEGIWVSGLPSESTIITIGQEYVANGSRVSVVGLEGEVDKVSVDTPVAESESGGMAQGEVL